MYYFKVHLMQKLECIVKSTSIFKTNTAFQSTELLNNNTTQFYILSVNTN